ncbi:MAG: DUF4389 domain-containing protein [Alphaproteobacteria bacterium]
MSGNIKHNITRCGIWLRLLYMIVLSMAYGVAEAVAFAVVVFQFVASLLTGKPNDNLARFGRNLARYFQQIIAYLTFATEEKPFPFMAWPDEPHQEAPVDEDSGQPDGTPENAGDAPASDEAGDANAEADAADADDAQGGDQPKD